MDKGYPVFIPGRHGLGDNIYPCFINKDTTSVFGKIYRAHLLGMMGPIVAVYEEFMNPSIPDIYACLPFPVKGVPTSQFGGVPVADCNNRFAEVVEGYYNAYSNLPPAIAELEPLPYTFPLLPRRKDLPEHYAVIAPEAGRQECFIQDKTVVQIMKEQLGVPVVTIGKAIPRNNMAKSHITADIDLRECCGIQETLSVYAHATLIVAAVSFARMAAPMFGTPVIELISDRAQHIADEARWHYDVHAYYIGELNTYLRWPSEQHRFIELLNRYKDKK